MDVRKDKCLLVKQHAKVLVKLNIKEIIVMNFAKMATLMLEFVKHVMLQKD